MDPAGARQRQLRQLVRVGAHERTLMFNILAGSGKSSANFSGTSSSVLRAAGGFRVPSCPACQQKISPAAWGCRLKAGRQFIRFGLQLRQALAEFMALPGPSARRQHAVALDAVEAIRCCAFPVHR
jgi:hypothetical protein